MRRPHRPQPVRVAAVGRAIDRVSRPSRPAAPTAAARDGGPSRWLGCTSWAIGTGRARRRPRGASRPTCPPTGTSSPGGTCPTGWARSTSTSIVVGRNAVYVCEEKSWGPHVVAGEVSWYVNGERRHNPAKQVAARHAGAGRADQDPGRGLAGGDPAVAARAEGRARPRRALARFPHPQRRRRPRRRRRAPARRRRGDPAAPRRRLPRCAGAAAAAADGVPARPAACGPAGGPRPDLPVPRRGQADAAGRRDRLRGPQPGGRPGRPDLRADRDGRRPGGGPELRDPRARRAGAARHGRPGVAGAGLVRVGGLRRHAGGRADRQHQPGQARRLAPGGVRQHRAAGARGRRTDRARRLPGARRGARPRHHPPGAAAAQHRAHRHRAGPLPRLPPRPLPTEATIAPVLDDNHPSAAFRPPGVALEMFQPGRRPLQPGAVPGPVAARRPGRPARPRPRPAPGRGVPGRRGRCSHAACPARPASRTPPRRPPRPPPRWSSRRPCRLPGPVGPEPIDVIEPDALLAGRYRLKRKLGEGAWAVTWLAVDENLDLPRTVKHMRPGRVTPEQVRAEFEHAAVLRSYHCAQVHDRLALPEPGALVQEYVPGQTLHELTQRPPRPRPRAGPADRRGRAQRPGRRPRRSRSTTGTSARTTSSSGTTAAPC